MVGFSDYVYPAVQAQLRQFDTSNVDSTNHSNGLADHNVSFLSPTRITTRGATSLLLGGLNWRIHSITYIIKF